MKIDIKHFKRTITIGQLAGINFEKNSPQQISVDQNLSHISSKELKKCIKSYKGSHKKKIKEIYAIEKEKLKLRDSITTVESIFKKEALYNIEREKLLNLSLKELSQIPLKINSLISIYEADWKWFEIEPFEKIFDIKKILVTKKSDHYFLFEKTGTFDSIYDTNISEFPLTEYQYYVLQLFEKKRDVKNVINDFIQLFDITNQKEEIEFFVVVEKLMKELIFRRFIVSPNKDIML